MKKLQATLLKPTSLLIALLAQSACQAPEPYAETALEDPQPARVLLDQKRWKLGDLDAETILFLEDGIPQHSTTVTNNNATDRWWTGLKIYGYKTWGTTPPIDSSPISDEEWEMLSDEELNLRLESHWGGGGSNACRSASALPEIKKGTVLMRPGETRSYQDAHPNYPDSPKRENVTSWSLTGKSSLPSDKALDEWPPFQINFEFSWDEEDGCHVVVKRSDL